MPGKGWPATAAVWVLLASPERIARNVSASLLASALRKYTTCIFPEALDGVSICVTRLRTRLIRAGLSERMSKLLVRTSGETTNRCPGSPETAPGTAGAAPRPSAISRLSCSAKSSAEAYCSLMTTSSPPLGWSIESMILLMRFTLSA